MMKSVTGRNKNGFQAETIHSLRSKIASEQGQLNRVEPGTSPMVEGVHQRRINALKKILKSLHGIDA
jgi:hypothetical protein